MPSTGGASGDVIRGNSNMADQVWFDVIALATSKGGAGKSTLARGLAAHWLALGRRPALIDADPTGTLSYRYNPEGPLCRAPAPATELEVPLQVLVPARIREELGIMMARERGASLRSLILRGIRSLGIEVTDEEIKGKRGRRRA
jgi:hypothetical protein